MVASVVTVFFFSTIVTFGFVSTFAFALVSVLSMIKTRDELRRVGVFKVPF